MLSLLLVASVLAVPLSVNAMAAPTPDTVVWSTETVDVGALYIEDTSIALDSNDNIHIAYNDASNGILKYAYWNGSVWNVDVVDDVYGSGQYNAIAIDSNDVPHIVYYGVGFGLRHAWLNGSTWFIEHIDSGGVGWYPSIAIDSNDTLHVSYYDYHNGDLKYAFYDGSNWTDTVVDDGSGHAVGAYCSIALNFEGYPCISYYSQSGDNLKYAWKESDGLWHNRIIDDEGNVGTHTSLAFGGEYYYPQISYYDETNGYLKYAYFDGEGWDSVTVDSDHAGQFSCMAVDADGTIHILYFDTWDNLLKYAFFSPGVGWTIETLLATGIYGFTSIDLASDGPPVISYGSADKHELVVASLNSGTWTYTTVDSAYTGLYTSIAVDSYGFPHISYYDNSSRSLQYALGWTDYFSPLPMETSATPLMAAPRWEYETVDSDGVGMYSSIAIDSSDCPHIAYYNETGGDLKHAWFDYDYYEWFAETVDSPGDVGLYTSIVIDPDTDDIHISYYDQTNSAVKYALWNGSSWAVEEVVDGVEPCTSIALDPDGNPYISFLHLNSGVGEVCYAASDGSSWNYDCLSTANSIGHWSSIIVDDSGCPYISYYDQTSNTLNCAYAEGLDWFNEIVDFGDFDTFNSIELDLNGFPRISYCDQTSGDLKYAAYDGFDWIIEVADSEDDVGYFSSIAVSFEGSSHISYYDAENGNLKYALGKHVSNFGYTMVDSKSPDGPVYQWIEISQSGTEILANADDAHEHVSFDFDFSFFDEGYVWSVEITSNGMLSFGCETDECTNMPITQTPDIDGFIAPYWDDLNPSASSGAVYYQTLGLYPNRMFVVEWCDVPHYDSDGSGVTFEAILYEGTNDILFQYKDIDFGVPELNNGASATVGIEGFYGNEGLQYSFEEDILEDGLAVLFKFPTTGSNLESAMSGPSAAFAGTNVTYTIYYSNTGTKPVHGVELMASLPDGANLVSASGDYAYESDWGVLLWDLGTLGVSDSGMYTFTVEVPDTMAAGEWIWTASWIEGSTGEIRYNDNEYYVDTQIVDSTLPIGANVYPMSGVSSGDPAVYCSDEVTFEYEHFGASYVEILIQLNDGGPDIVANMTGGPYWTHTTTLAPRYGHANVTFIAYSDVTLAESFGLYVDPAGYIYDYDTLERIEGATVWLQRPDGLGGWENVPTGAAIMIPDVNPQITGPDGQYQWDTFPGTYRVHVEAPDYFPETSYSVTVPPPVTDLHVGLYPADSTELSINFVPSEVDPALYDSTDISGTLTSEGTPIEDQVILLYWQDSYDNWNYIGNAATDNNGNYFYTWTPDPAMPHGYYALKAVFLGDEMSWYLASEAITAPTGLLVVPEYFLGGLLALIACFAAFALYKKPRLQKTQQ
ncbi:MAG: hypothetical protein NWF04_00500 [Candidatus Bathyarchaeota archaeon]|nr:hypothetical protein [Candidatus Bathyarchaeota archaeon]